MQLALVRCDSYVQYIYGWSYQCLTQPSIVLMTKTYTEYYYPAGNVFAC